MEMVIQVQVKKVYGEERIYPINGPAKIFAEMLNQKSITRRDIKYMRELGYQIEVIQEKVEL